MGRGGLVADCNAAHAAFDTPEKASRGGDREHAHDQGEHQMSMTLNAAKALAFTAGETFKTARGLAKFGDDALPLAQSSFKSVGAAVAQLNTRAAQGAIGGRVNFASDAHKAMSSLIATADSGVMPGVAAVTSAQSRVDLLVRAVLQMP